MTTTITRQLLFGSTRQWFHPRRGLAAFPPGGTTSSVRVRDALSRTFLWKERSDPTRPFTAVSHVTVYPLTKASPLKDEEDDLSEKEDSLGEEEADAIVHDTAAEDRRSHPTGSYRHQRLMLHFGMLKKRTPAELMHEASRIASSVPPLYSCSYRTRLPSTSGSNDATKSTSFPMIFHAVRVIQVLSHPDIVRQADAEQQTQMLRLTFQLIDRLVREEAAYQVPTERLHSNCSKHEKNVVKLQTTSHNMAPGLLDEKSLLYGVMLRWKDLSLYQSNATTQIPSPKELLSQLQTWSSLLSNASSQIQLYRTTVINMIVEVILKQHPDPAQAPIVAEQLLQFIWASEDATRLQPDSFTYGLILTAWSQSKLPQAAERMDVLIREMKEQHGIHPTAVTYYILLRHSASQGNLERLQSIIQRLKDEGHEMNAQVLSEVAYCYCQTGNLQEASDTIYQMLDLPSDVPVSHERERMREAIITSVFNLLTHYREAILSPGSFQLSGRQYIAAAERLVRTVQANGFIMNGAHCRGLQMRLDNALTYIYASAGRLDTVETMFENELNPSFLSYMALVEAYKESCLPEQATKVLHRLLDDPNVVSFTSYIFSAVIGTWSRAQHPQALEQSLDIIALMEEHPRCLALQVRPCPAVFNGVLHILSNLTSATCTTVTTPRVPSFLDERALQYAICGIHDPHTSVTLDTCRFSIAILDEVERRYQKDGFCKPNVITYSIIIKTCFRANQLVLADQIMKRMEASDTPPEIKTYNIILSHYASFKSTAGAEQAEKILLYLQEHARDKPRIRPNINSYSIVLTAWRGTGDPQSLDRMWNIYELVLSEGIEIDVLFGITLIRAMNLHKDSLSSPMAVTRPAESRVAPSSPSSIWMQRAMMVLQKLEENKNMAKKPDIRSYKFLLDMCLRSNDVLAATSLVLHMVDAYTSGRNPHAQPNQTIFQRVIEAWIQHGDLIKATMFANKMRELFLQGHIPMGPGLNCYTTLQSAWQRSIHPKREVFLTSVESQIKYMKQVPEPTFLDIANAAAAKAVHHLHK